MDDDSFVPSSKQPSVIYCRLTDFLCLYSFITFFCSDFILYRKVGRRRDFEKGEAKHGIPILHPLLLCQDSSLSISGSSRKVFTLSEPQAKSHKPVYIYLEVKLRQPTGQRQSNVRMQKNNNWANLIHILYHMIMRRVWYHPI